MCTYVCTKCSCTASNTYCRASNTLAAPTAIRNSSVVLNVAGNETPADTIIYVSLLSTTSTTAGASRMIRLFAFELNLNKVRFVHGNIGHDRRLFLLQGNFGVLFCR